MLKNFQIAITKPYFDMGLKELARVAGYPVVSIDLVPVFLSLSSLRPFESVMPPKGAKTQRKGATSCQDVCSICCQKIGPKDEVLFCSGSWQKHLHCYCASVSEQCYKTLTSDGGPPFLCFCCFRTQKDDEVLGTEEAVGSPDSVVFFSVGCPALVARDGHWSS